MEFDPLPQGLICAGCGYELSGLTARTCPECGRTVVPSDLTTHTRRVNARAGFSRRLWRHAFAWALVIALIGAASLAASKSLKTAMINTGLAGAVVAISTFIGAAAARAGRAGDRRPYVLAWLIAQWWLHLAWMLIAPAMIIVVGVDALDRWMVPPRGNIGAAVAVTIGAVLWCVFVLGGLAVWAVKFGERSRRFGGTGERQVALATIGALVVLLLAAGFGIKCGSDGMAWASRVAPGIAQWP